VKKVILACVVFLAGCACQEKSTVHEIEYGAFEHIQRTVLSDYRADGWTCNSEGTIRSNGQVIGERYSCTRCN
jgi:hypothetical protein